MATCPKCKKEISYIREFQETEVCYNVSLVKYNTKEKPKKGDECIIHYDKDDGYEGCATEWGFAECPECGEEIPGIRSEDMAEQFLKGEITYVADLTKEETETLYAGLKWKYLNPYWIEVEEWKKKKE